MLARLPKKQVRALFPDASAFVDRTGVGPLRYRELRQLLDVVEIEGHATEDGEVTPGMASVAVVVPDHVGWPAAAVAVTFPAGAEPDGIVSEVTAAADELSRRIRGRS